MTSLRDSFGRSIVELVLIVVGVLIALWVDEWRSELDEKNAVQRHLEGIVGEIDANLYTLHAIREGYLPKQFVNIGNVIGTLDQPEPKIDDPEQFVEMLIHSSERASPWFQENSFESFRISAQYHSSYVQGLAQDISDTYEAIDILFRNRFDNDDAYLQAVSRLVPARYQSENNEMRTYTPDRFSAPVIADDEPTDRVIASIVDNRAMLVQLARSKAERVTGKWYAVTRIILEFQNVRDEILAQPVMQGVDVAISEDHKTLEDKRI